MIVWYKNYRGEEGYRDIRPISLRWGTSEWHKEPQWLMLAHDVVKGESREFAMKDMRDHINSSEVPFANFAAAFS